MRPATAIRPPARRPWPVAAGAGAGLGEPERESWRARARQWLRADLASLANPSAIDDPEAIERLRSALASWKTDPRLDGLRDPAAIEKLPPAERLECRRLWSDIEAVLNLIK